MHAHALPTHARTRAHAHLQVVVARRRRGHGWKGQLLRQLYYEAEAQMLGGFSATARPQLVAEAKAELERRVADWPAEARAKALARHYDPYWLALDAASHERQARQVNRKPQLRLVLCRPRCGR